MAYNYPINQTWRKVSDSGVSFLEVAEVRAWLNLTLTDDDALLQDLIDTATEVIENRTGLILMSTTMEMYLDKFPRWTILIPGVPLQTVSNVSYMDDDGNYVQLDANEYQIDIYSQPGRLAPVPNTHWPCTPQRLNAVQIGYLSGFGAAGDLVPQDIRQAGLQLIAHWYEHRESVSAESRVQEVPQTIEYTLAAHDVGELY